MVDVLVQLNDVATEKNQVFVTKTQAEDVV